MPSSLFPSSLLSWYECWRGYQSLHPQRKQCPSLLAKPYSQNVLRVGIKCSILGTQSTEYKMLQESYWRATRTLQLSGFKFTGEKRGYGKNTRWSLARAEGLWSVRLSIFLSSVSGSYYSVMLMEPPTPLPRQHKDTSLPQKNTAQ